MTELRITSFDHHGRLLAGVTLGRLSLNVLETPNPGEITLTTEDARTLAQFILSETEAEPQ
jgi:hypothetical protein